MKHTTEVTVHDVDRVEMKETTRGSHTWTEFKFLDKEGNVLATATAFAHSTRPVQFLVGVK